MMFSRTILCMVFVVVLLVSGSAYAVSKDSYGFAKLPAGNDPYPGSVAISIPPNCPSQMAQNARALMAALKQQGIPVQEFSQIGFKFNSQAEADQISAIMDAFQPPHVIINGKIAGNPSYAQIIGELRYQYYGQ